MSNPSSPSSSNEASDQLDTEGTAAPSKLQTSKGNTTIADTVVQKIAGISAGEVSGVYALGGGTARTLGAIRERIPGASQSAGQGVAVEVGERQAAIDLDLVTEYGVSIVELGRAVRRNVISAVEGMTGLEVTELNVFVNDIHLPSDNDHLPSDNDEDGSESRVQ
ncbi:Asp23/Gls24 family envelope stress response protein [soil metagenome]